MNGSLYLLFLVTAFVTIVSPGPGVLMSIMKTMQCGYKGAFWTICGTSGGTLVMAAISGTGLGLLLSHSPQAYAALRLVGACYLIWLGIKSWRAKPSVFSLANAAAQRSAGASSCDKAPEIRQFAFFAEGIMLQMTNPVLIMFFVSLFPQFIDPKLSYALQYSVLALTYWALVFLVHTGYSLLTMKFRGLLKNERAVRGIYRTGAVLFFLLSAMVFRDALLS